MAKPKVARESRIIEERLSQLRDGLNMNWVDPLYIDPEKIPGGFEYRWIRESTYDQPDTSRIVEMKRKGWTPVPAERHPEMVPEDFLGRTTHLKGFIFHKGLILFERPKEVGALEQKAMSQYNAKIMKSMPGLDNFMGDPYVQGKFLPNPMERSGQTEW
jgi:hypothetical protein